MSNAALTAPIRSPEKTPFKVEINGSGFSHSADFATVREAYTEARRIQQTAAEKTPVRFMDRFGHDGLYTVLQIRLFRWNPLTGKHLCHARSWELNEPAPNALTPYPDAWHDEPLPDNWRTDPTPDPEPATAPTPPTRQTALQPKPWIAVIELCARAYISHLRHEALCRERWAHYQKAGRFYLGQRVSITVDELNWFQDRIYRGRIGDLGTIAHMPSKNDPDYGVILDNDPRGRRHAFGENDLAPVPILHSDDAA